MHWSAGPEAWADALAPRARVTRVPASEDEPLEEVVTKSPGEAVERMLEKGGNYHVLVTPL